MATDTHISKLVSPFPYGAGVYSPLGGGRARWRSKSERHGHDTRYSIAPCLPSPSVPAPPSVLRPSRSAEKCSADPRTAAGSVSGAGRQVPEEQSAPKSAAALWHRSRPEIGLLGPNGARHCYGRLAFGRVGIQPKVRPRKSTSCCFSGEGGASRGRDRGGRGAGDRLRLEA